MRSALLAGRDHHDIGAVAAVAEGQAAITLSRGGASKTYSHSEPNEDAVAFAFGEGGFLVAVADGHDGSSGSLAVIEYTLSELAPAWTGAAAPHDGDTAWREAALDALVACNHEVLACAAKLELPPAPTTLCLALVRPREGILVHASAGDSHVFQARTKAAIDLGWASLGRKRSYFLGYAAETREREQEKSIVGVARLDGTRAIVLATDGLSERGVGVADPAAAVHAAVEASREDAPDLRALGTCKRVTNAALEAQRSQRAGDNVACAVLWLSG
jgi:serine/threonine protein phosphatase PrpC